MKDSKILPSTNELITKLFDQLSLRQPNVVWDRAKYSAQQAIDQDSECLDKLVGQVSSKSLIRLWQNKHCIVIPRRFTALSNFNEASVNSNLPVVVRRSGGTAVVHGPHVINISVLRTVATKNGFAIDECYSDFRQSVLPALAGLGLVSTLGPVPKSHCDGRFNLRSGDRKIGGTAAFVKHYDKMRGYVVHANINIHPSIDDLEAIMKFERALGMTANYLCSAHSSLFEELDIVKQSAASLVHINEKKI